VDRGYQVIAFARERSGIGGRQSRDEVIADFPGAEVRFGDVTDPASIAAEAFDQPTDVVGELPWPSRTGGRKDSWAIDHAATLNTYKQGRTAGVAHYVLLSAICVQKPLLEFQKAKLAFEAVLQADEEMSHSIGSPHRLFSKAWADRWKAAARAAPTSCSEAEPWPAASRSAKPIWPGSWRTASMTRPNATRCCPLGGRGRR